MVGSVVVAQNNSTEYEYEFTPTAQPTTLSPTMHTARFCKKRCFNTLVHLSPKAYAKACTAYGQNKATYQLVQGCVCKEFNVGCNNWLKKNH